MRTIFDAPLWIGMATFVLIAKLVVFFNLPGKLLRGFQLIWPLDQSQQNGIKKKDQRYNLAVTLFDSQETTFQKLPRFDDFSLLVILLAITVVNHIFISLWETIVGEKSNVTMIITVPTIVLLMYTLTRSVFETGVLESDETIISMWASVFSFFVSFFALYGMEGSVLVFPISKAYAEFAQHWAQYGVSLPEDPTIFKLFLSIMAGLLCGLLYSPTKRMTRNMDRLHQKWSSAMWWDYVSIFFSFVSFCLPPLYVTLHIQQFTVRGPFAIIAKEGQLASFRLQIIYLFIFLRLLLLRPYLKQFTLGAVDAIEAIKASFSGDPRFSEMTKRMLYRFIRVVPSTAVDILGPTALFFFLATILQSKSSADIGLISILLRLTTLNRWLGDGSVPVVSLRESMATRAAEARARFMDTLQGVQGVDAEWLGNLMQKSLTFSVMPDSSWSCIFEYTLWCACLFVTLFSLIEYTWAKANRLAANSSSSAAAAAKNGGEKESKKKDKKK